MASAFDGGFVADFTPVKRILAGLALTMTNFMVVLDMSIANVSIPHISGNLGITPQQGTWVITSYAVAEAICVPLTGWLALRFGAVRTLTTGIFGFGVFSLLCGLSTSLTMLVACRVGQGMFGGLLMPLTQTLLLRIFPPQQRALAVGIWSMTTLLGPALGPIIGGYISDGWSWHWIFLINIPLAVVLVLASINMLGDVETDRQRLPIDAMGLFLLVLWVGSLQIMVDTGREHDWFSHPMIVILALVAAVGFVSFIIWELTAEHPIVDLRIFRYPAFSFGMAALAVCFGAYFASVVLTPQWLQLSMNYTAMDAGLATAFTAMAAIVASQFAARMVTKIDPRRLVIGAFLWFGLVSYVRVFFWSTEVTFAVVAWTQLVQGFALPFFFVSLTAITLGTVKPEETASAAGLQNFMRTSAAAIGTSLALTEWDRGDRMAQTAIAGELNQDMAMSVLRDAGFSDAQARVQIAQMVHEQAQSLSLNHLFMITGAIFVAATILIWMIPRRRFDGKLP